MTEITRFEQDMDGSMEPEEYGTWVRFDDYDSKITALRAELETERMRLVACGVAAPGDFDGCKDEYRPASLEDALRLYAANTELKAENERLKAESLVNYEKASALFTDEIARLRADVTELKRQRDVAIALLDEACDDIEDLVCRVGGTNPSQDTEQYRAAIKGVQS